MDSKAVRCFALAVTLVVAFAAPSVVQAGPALTASDPWRLTLSDEQMTHDALFQPVSIGRPAGAGRHDTGRCRAGSASTAPIGRCG